MCGLNLLERRLAESLTTVITERATMLLDPIRGIYEGRSTMEIGDASANLAGALRVLLAQPEAGTRSLGSADRRSGCGDQEDCSRRRSPAHVRGSTPLPFDVIRHGSTCCAISLRTTIVLALRTLAACSIVIQFRASSEGQAGNPLECRTCCTRFSVQVLANPSSVTHPIQDSHNRVKSERHSISLSSQPWQFSPENSTWLTLRESNPERGRSPFFAVDQLRSSYCEELAF